MKFLLYILSISILLSCCKDDDEGLIPNLSCQERAWANAQNYADLLYYGFVDNPSCGFGIRYTELGNYRYNYLSVNPNNANQLCFIRESIDFSSRELVVYDICDNSLNVIATNPNYNTSWSAKDWILFTGQDIQLWKVKSNGDSLTQLTNTGSFNNDAVWNTSGTAYFYYDAQSFERYVSDENGNILKSFSITDFPYRLNTWLNDSTIISVTGANGGGILKTFNLNTKVSETLPFSFFDSTISRFTRSIYAKNEYIYICTDRAILEYNGNINLIDSSYQSYLAYFFLPIENNHYIINRSITDTTGLYSCRATIKSHISIYNRSTGEERYLPVE